MAKIYAVRRQGEIIGYSLDLGKTATSDRQRQFFKTEAEAIAAKGAYAADPDVSVLVQHKNEFLRAFEKLQANGGTLEQAVDFWIKHGARKGNPAIDAVIEQWADEKIQTGCKYSYVNATTKHLHKFRDYVGANTPIGDIERDKIRDFVFKKHAHVNEVTKNNLIRNLSVLFGFAMKKEYTGINPVEKIDRLVEKDKKPAIITPEDFKTLLDRCLRKGWIDRLTVFVLVGFCGIRTEEACQLQWKHINMADKSVEVPHEIAKKNSWRTNIIPDNAMAWLERIYDGRLSEKRIIGENYVALLRSAVKYAHINHAKNCIRHSFASYSIALKGADKLPSILADMGHAGNSTTFYSNYRNVVNNKSLAEAYWSIRP